MQFVQFGFAEVIKNYHFSTQLCSLNVKYFDEISDLINLRNYSVLICCILIRFPEILFECKVF